MKKYKSRNTIRDMVSLIFNREYEIAYRTHTVGMEEMDISPATRREIYREAQYETEREIDRKRWKLYMAVKEMRA